MNGYSPLKADDPTLSEEVFPCVSKILYHQSKETT